MKEIKVVFYANVEDHDYQKVKKGFSKCGAEIIESEFPELKDIGYFSVEEVSTAE